MNKSHDKASTGASETLRQEAWHWLRTLNSGDVRAVDAKAFKRWVQSSPENQAAYHQARQQWSQLQPVAQEVLRTDPHTASRVQRHRRAVPGRRAFLGAATGLTAVAVAAIVVRAPGGMWPALDEWGADVRTAKGEQRTVTLAQGVVTLNTRSSMRQHTDANQSPGIDLLAGEAAIDLAGDTPFMVVAGNGRSLATLSRFEVRNLEGQGCVVTCIEGTVRVEHPSGSNELLAGQQLRYNEQEIGSIASVDPAIASAWRRGELVFDGKPLAQVIDEINRYRPGRVVLMNDKASVNSVTGSFPIAALDQALNQLQHTFGLQANALPGGLLLLS